MKKAEIMKNRAGKVFIFQAMKEKEAHAWHW